MEKQEVTPPAASLEKLVSLIAALRGENGCPWDKKQTAKTMAVYLMEEAHELVEAIHKGDAASICEELGDVLFHILFVARLFQEQGAFDIKDVILNNHDKMVRRHPHVFGEKSLQTADEVKKQWREIKKSEKSSSGPGSVLDSVPGTLPGLMRAYRISERAAGHGFDWENMAGVLTKAEEEWDELKYELEKDALQEDNRKAVSLEFGDLLFTLVNVARFAKIHPETAISEAVLKFKTRFQFMERLIRDGHRELTDVSQEEKDILWEKAKASV
ncbi:MAG: nucleoside triphosphate pyrophosphohydrolase [Pseudomonadota bacterium]